MTKYFMVGSCRCASRGSSYDAIHHCRVQLRVICVVCRQRGKAWTVTWSAAEWFVWKNICRREWNSVIDDLFSGGRNAPTNRNLAALIFGTVSRLHTRRRHTFPCLSHTTWGALYDGPKRWAEVDWYIKPLEVLFGGVKGCSAPYGMVRPTGRGNTERRPAAPSYCMAGLLA